MARRLGIAVLLLAAGTLAAPARGVICALDRAPAATLLLPYFEVDLDHADGRTTLFSLDNASASAVLTQLTLWTDQGVPTLAFPIYLTGYDVQTVNLRDLFNGVYPRTATVGQDPADAISPHGDYSQDLNYSSCAGFLPPPAPPASLVESLRAAHTGRFASALHGCAGQNLGDNLARGYVTIDTVNACGNRVPSDPGYFGPSGVATADNVLWGDFFLVDTASGFAQGDNLVRIEADPQAFHPGDATFYGRYVGYSAADAREPLAVAWETRFVTGGALAGGTDLLFWRDSGEAVQPFPCGAGAGPLWYPLRLAHARLIDEQENPLVEYAFPFDHPRFETIFPAEANRYRLGGDAQHPLPFPFGWMYFELGGETATRKPIQSWAVTLISAAQRWSLGFSATPVLDVCHRRTTPSPQPGI